MDERYEYESTAHMDRASLESELAARSGTDWKLVGVLWESVCVWQRPYQPPRSTCVKCGGYIETASGRFASHFDGSGLDCCGSGSPAQNGGAK